MMRARVPHDRLTRQELSWLLAQEARGAAKALREGVSHLTQPASDASAAAPPVALTLDALDDAISLLSDLQSAPPGRARHGRIDVASMMCELLPEARIAMEPGAGTEVFGDEADLRRMLLVLASQTQGNPNAATSAAAEISVRREDDMVRIAVNLGPDSSATAELERRWLHRMATRLGGRFELDGSTQSLLLPADGDEVSELRRELAQAQQLGEVYARELASVLAGAQRSEPPASDRGPVASGTPLHGLACLSLLMSRALRAHAEAQLEDATAAGSLLGEELPVARRLRQRGASLNELAGELLPLVEVQRIVEGTGEADAARVDVTGLAQECARGAAAKLHRLSLQIEVEATGPLWVVAPRRGLELLLSALCEHAMQASPRGSQLAVRCAASNESAVVWVEDSGPVVPEAQREAVLRLRTDPAAAGRPASVSLLGATILADALGLPIGLTEAPNGRSAVRVEVGRLLDR